MLRVSEGASHDAATAEGLNSLRSREARNASFNNASHFLRLAGLERIDPGRKRLILGEKRARGASGGRLRCGQVGIAAPHTALGEETTTGDGTAGQRQSTAASLHQRDMKCNIALGLADLPPLVNQTRDTEASGVGPWSL